MYYNRLKNSKIVISDFHLAKLENGLIKEPCGTPEYLGKEGRDRGWWRDSLQGETLGWGKVSVPGKRVWMVILDTDRQMDAFLL